jgi:hypothetical protein
MIVQAVLREVDGNQFEDGGHGGHIDNCNTGHGMPPNLHVEN